MLKSISADDQEEVKPKGNRGSVEGSRGDGYVGDNVKFFGTKNSVDEDKEDEDKEGEEEEEEEEDLSGGRRRKVTERFADTFQRPSEAKKVEVVMGKGVKLEDMPNVMERLLNIPRTAPVLTNLHHVIFGRVGKKSELKGNFRLFSGVVLSDQSDRTKLKARLESKKWTLPMLKEGMDLLEVPRFGSSFEGKTPDKSKLIERFMEWLENPQPSGKKLPGKTKAKGKRKAPGKGAKRVQKVAKVINNTSAEGNKGGKGHAEDGERTESEEDGEGEGEGKGEQREDEEGTSSNGKEDAAKKTPPKKRITTKAKAKTTNKTKRKKGGLFGASSNMLKKRGSTGTAGAGTKEEPARKKARKSPAKKEPTKKTEGKKEASTAKDGGGETEDEDEDEDEDTEEGEGEEEGEEEGEGEEELEEEQDEGVNGEQGEDEPAKPSGPTAAELRKKVDELIGLAENVENVTFKQIRGQLEEHFQCQLTDRKAELIQIVSESMQ
ncbi:unnamed protein product [Choristocarpus tenellus]